MDIILEKLRRIDKYKDYELADIRKVFDLENSDEELINELNGIINPIRKQLSITLNNSKVCLLTGNGSSIYAGTKTTTIFDAGCYFSNASEEETNILKVINDSNVEKVLNNLLILKNYNDLCKLDNDIINEKIDFIKNDFIANNVENLDYKTLLYHDILIRKLKTLNLLEKTTIFTLNYDLAFEYSFDKNGVNYNDGFSGFINRTFTGRNLDLNDGCPTICKLHGSLNWHIGENSFDIKEKQPIFLEDGTIKHEDNGFLIYPTTNKFMDSQNYPFSELMRSFLNKITNEKCSLFILGYKFEDSHVNDVIMKALMNPNLIINIFNYNASNDFIDKLKKLSYSDDRINYFEGEFIADFRTFCKFLLPAIDEKNDIDKIRELLLGGGSNE